MTEVPEKSDLIALGRRAEEVYDRAEDVIRRGKPFSMDSVDAGMGRDLWRKVLDIAPGAVAEEFPEAGRLTGIGRAATLAVDAANLESAVGSMLDLYAAIGEKVWTAATAAKGSVLE
jgi:hypothetical protein